MRPTASLGGSVTLSRTALAGASYQWRLDGVDLVGQTNRTLNLTNLTADMAGRYSVVVSNTTTMTTNFVYLFVDTQFTKITTGAVVADTGMCPAVASGDYDGDGYADLFACRYQLGTSAVYRNNRDGTFVRVLNLPFGTQSKEIGVWGDWDNDGSVDLLHELIGPLGGTSSRLRCTSTTEMAPTLCATGEHWSAMGIVPSSTMTTMDTWMCNTPGAGLRIACTGTTGIGPSRA